MKVPMLLAFAELSMSIAQAAEPTGTLTLACEATATKKHHEEFASIGVVFDFTARRLEVLGYHLPLHMMDIVGKTGANVMFIAAEKGGSRNVRNFSGIVNRVTGDLEAIQWCRWHSG
jgi:hypothetical protein